MVLHSAVFSMQPSELDLLVMPVRRRLEVAAGGAVGAVAVGVTLHSGRLRNSGRARQPLLCGPSQAYTPSLSLSVSSHLDPSQ